MNQEQINKQILKRLEQIERVVFKSQKKKEDNLKQSNSINIVKIGFNLNVRAFFKKYSKGLTGTKNFTLIAAFLSKGQIGKSISAENIADCWNKNFSFLGGKKLTSRTYGTRAKENEWLDSKKYGFYELTSKWQEIFD